jgi:hypothetical protein
MNLKSQMNADEHRHESPGAGGALPKQGRADLPVRRNFAAGKLSNVGGLRISLALDWKLRRRGSTALPAEA